MRLKEIIETIEQWAPLNIAREHDSVGLQIGSEKKVVRNILLTLDVTPSVINEAERKKTDLIISHHPVIFQPIHSILDNVPRGYLISQLVKKDIALYVAHTNLDYTHQGVSYWLAKKLDLQKIEILKPLTQHMKKIVVFVPADYVEKLTSAMAKAGAGIIGNYEACSFRVQGTGTFKPLEGSNPFIGKIGSLEKVNEIRLEMILPDWNVSKVIEAMLKTHPYEEVAYDIYPLENENKMFGAGAIGELKNSITLKSFLIHLKKKLGTDILRYTGDLQKKVRYIAVCGGNGTDLLSTAISRSADVFVTADIKYHAYHEAYNKISLVDAGHYETEYPILDALRKYIKNKFNTLNVYISKKQKNPIQYYIP